VEAQLWIKPYGMAFTQTLWPKIYCQASKTDILMRLSRGIGEFILWSQWIMEAREGLNPETLPHEGLGDITINNEVITTIVSVAVHEVEGIAGLAGGKSSFTDILSRKDAQKGITVEMTHEAINSISVEVSVEYGIDIYKAARQLQMAIKNSVEGMTGLRVEHVNVTVRGIIMGDQTKRQISPPAEIEAISGGE